MSAFFQFVRPPAKVGYGPYPRDEEIKTGCLATFTVTYRGEPGSTLIGFSLADYELGRQHMAELDRQIIEALTGEEVEASDMDL